MQINYFSDSEFERTGYPAKPSHVEKFLLNFMRQFILNPIRAEINSPVVITGCYRTEADFLRLASAGRNPSQTSDHFWNQSIPSFRPIDVDRFGKHFTYSVGAVDFVTPKMDIEKAFDAICELVRSGKIVVGQAIIEKNSSGNKWIHVSNPKKLLYSTELREYLGFEDNRLMRSDDNGLTFSHIPSTCLG